MSSSNTYYTCNSTYSWINRIGGCVGYTEYLFKYNDTCSIFSHFRTKDYKIILNKINICRFTNQESVTFIQPIIDVACNVIYYLIIVLIFINNILIISLYAMLNKYENGRFCNRHTLYI